MTQERYVKFYNFLNWTRRKFINFFFFSTRDIFKKIKIQYRVKFLLSTKLMIEIIFKFLFILSTTIV